MDKILAILTDVIGNFKGKGSWKTGVAGISVAIATVLTMVVAPLTDGDPNTGVDILRTLEGVAIALGIYSARDDDKTSEDVGNK